MDGKCALITGAASGIGKATAVAYARRGVNVSISDIDKKGLDNLEKELRGLNSEVLVVPCDVSSPDEVKELVYKTAQYFEGLDFAVNNAGIEGLQAPTAEYTLEDWDRVINVNLRGQWICMKHEIDIMLDHDGGSIVNISSILGKVGFARAPAYTAAKHGLIGLTKAAALEYSDQGVRVNAVCPGFIETPMLDRAGITTDEDTRQSIVALHPIGRLGTSEEVAEAIVWISSDEASFVTGHSLLVDGGYTAK